MVEEKELDRALHQSTVEEMTDWLIEYHGAHLSSRNTIISNLKEAYLKEKIKGSLTPQTIDIEITLFGFKILRIKTTEEEKF